MFTGFILEILKPIPRAIPQVRVLFKGKSLKNPKTTFQDILIWSKLCGVF